MTNEREQERREQEREERGATALARMVYDQLIELIKRLRKKEDKNPDQEKRLRQAEGERNRRLRAFFQLPGFGQRTKNILQQSEQRLSQALQTLRSVSNQEFRDKKQIVDHLLEQVEQQKAEHCLQEPEELEEALKGIAKKELEELVKESKEMVDQEVLRRSSGEQPSQEGINEARERGRRLIKETFIGLPENQQEEIVNRIINDSLQKGMNIEEIFTSRGERRWSYFSEEEKNLIKDAKNGEALRKAIMDEFFQQVDMYPSEFYGQVVQAMGLEALNKMAEFRELLGKIEGKEGQKVRDDFAERSKLAQMIHNATAAMEGGAAKPDKFGEMMERFTPELLDQLFLEDEAELTAHLYETGMTTLRSRGDNWIMPELVGHDPHQRISEIDKWVRKRFEEVVKARDGLSQEEFEKEWPEQRIKRAMALGKGYEMIVLRMPEMVARGRIPQYITEAGIVISPAYEDFVRTLDMFEHFMEKFQGYDDPGFYFWMFLLTGEKVSFQSKKDMIDFFQRKYNVHPGSLRMTDVVNFLDAGGHWSKTGWRREMVTEDIDEEDKKWLGLAFRIAEHRKDPKKKKEIILEEFERNPLRILREAELQDGEIFDYQLGRKVVYQTLRNLGRSETESKTKAEEFFPPEPKQRPGEKKEDFEKRLNHFRKIELKKVRQARGEVLDPIEDSLILLAQLEADWEKGRKGRIDFSQIRDPQARKRAEAYYQAIKKVVVEEKADWREWNGRKKDDTLIDYLAQKDFPYAPGLEDTPWSRLNFAKMGHKGFARRLRDYMAAESSMKALYSLQTSFAKLRKPEDLVKQIDEVWLAMGNYDKVSARERMTKIYEGIGRFNSADYLKRYLPAPLGSIVDWARDFLGLGTSSYAKEIFGEAACSWRAVDLQNFLKHARLAGHITKEQEEKLAEKLRCTFGSVAVEFLSRWTPAFIGLVIYTFIKQLAEELQEQFKEEEG